MEAVARERGSEWEDVLGSGQLMKRVVRDGQGNELPTDGQWVTIKVALSAFETTITASAVVVSESIE